MINSTCKKADFQLYKEIANGVFELRWGYEDVMEKVRQLNEETGKWELTGEVRETELCSYEMERIYAPKLTKKILDGIFSKSSRIPSMEEMKFFGELVGMTEEQMLPWMKEQLKRAINRHDKSRGANGVENFSIGGVNVWMDKDTRTGLLLRFQAEKAAGKTDTVLWHEGMKFPLVVDVAIQMLYAIEVYASATYDKTAEHLAEVNKLESVGALVAYDFKAGYPTQLQF